MTHLHAALQIPAYVTQAKNALYLPTFVLSPRQPGNANSKLVRMKPSGKLASVEIIFTNHIAQRAFTANRNQKFA